MKTESLAREFDKLVKGFPKTEKVKENSSRIKKSSSKGKIKTQKDKKGFASNNNSKGKIVRLPSGFSDESFDSPHEKVIKEQSS